MILKKKKILSTFSLQSPASNKKTKKEKANREPLVKSFGLGVRAEGWRGGAALGPAKALSESLSSSVK